jgi:hypothetical protein
MSLDELVLGLQRLADRAIRRLRLGRPPVRGRRRLLVVQIDGLPRSVFEQAVAEGRMPFVRRLLQRHGYRLTPMNVSLPTSTPAFQFGAMYGRRPDIPGFHFHDKRRRSDVYFPRAGDAAWIEQDQGGGRLGVLEGGSAYGCVFTGGAANNLFTLAKLKRPSGAGLLRGFSAFFVFVWVVGKSFVASLLSLGRALLRFIADPVGESRRGWKWLAIKIGVSVWVREFFTLAVSRDLYAGVPAVWVNYLDFDVFGHAYGPQHRRARGALRRVDRSIHQLWRTLRRVPEYRYDLYLLADHGQMFCTPYVELQHGEPLEKVLMREFFEPAGGEEVHPGRPQGRHLARGIKAWRSRRAPGLFQRFITYLERDFPRLMGELPESHERHGVRIIGAGPNAFVYFLRTDEPVTLEWIDQHWPGVADEISRSRGIGFVLARSAGGPVCIVRGKRWRLDAAEPGPFAQRPDRDLVLAGIRGLMEMRSAGDLVIYGNDSPEGNVSYVHERGAHAGPSEEEMETFVVTPPGVTLPRPLVHPTQLYPHFVRYQGGARAA